MAERQGRYEGKLIQVTSLPNITSGVARDESVSSRSVHWRCCMRIADRVLIVLSLVLLGISSGAGQALNKEIKIGFSIENVKGERWQTDLNDFQSRAHELGAAVVIRSALQLLLPN